MAGDALAVPARPDAGGDWIARLPKAEIHLHLEGAATPEFLVELARRRGESLPLEDARARFNYSGFMGFLTAYKWACDQLSAPQDYAALLRDLAARLRAQNVLYAELTLSAGVVLWKQQDLDALCEALVRATEEVQREQGLEVRWILDAVRNFGANHVARVAEHALRWKDAGVVAFGVGGYEAQGPAELFRDTFEKIRAAGLRVTIHAGETEGPASIWSAIRNLGAERIGHGLAAFRDPELMDYLKEKQITLEVCPSSNVRTGALRQHTGSDDLATHPLVAFVRRGLRVTLNTDDPGFFDTDLNREYALAHQLGLSREELLRVAEAAFASAFCEEPLRLALLARFREASQTT